MIFDIENQLWKSNFFTIWHLPTSIISFGYVDFYAKIFVILYPHTWNSITGAAIVLAY